jgi:hypothetical protein
MKTLCFLKLLSLVLFVSGCATDLPIKTARDTSIITGEAPAPDDSDSISVHSTETEETKSAQPTAPPAAPSKNETAATTPATSDTKHLEKVELNQLEIQKFAYELGFDPKKPLTEEQKKQIVDRKRLRELERSLDTHKERLQYSKVLPWFKNDQEKIEMLNIPSIEGRQVWINKNKIWSRAKSLKEYDEVVESADIAMGMPAEYVKKSWGEPDNIETSGNPIYRNERWHYNKQVSTPQGYKNEKRLVYFEGGRVVGWETE